MKKLFFILSIFILSARLASAQTAQEKIDSLLDNYYAEGVLNGAVLVSVNGEIFYQNGFGFANFEESIPNDPKTIFEIGSCTKQFTAALIMMLREEGKIDLEAKITDYLPYYPQKNGDKITIHHLLSHTSGIPECLNLPKMKALLFKENDPVELMDIFWNRKLDFEPGSNLKYSNSGFLVLGVIIEAITGKSYEDVLHERIFTPLKMASSGVVDITNIRKGSAYGYIKIKNKLTTAPRWNLSCAYSAGAIYSTIEDLYKWQLALQSNSLLSKESMEIMLTPNFSQYGYGFAILNRSHKDGNKYTLYGHEGDTPGFRSLINIVREDNSSVIILDNNRNTNHFKIATAIRNIIYENN